jgi:hypothetical protein
MVGPAGQRKIDIAPKPARTGLNPDAKYGRIRIKNENLRTLIFLADKNCETPQIHVRIKTSEVRSGSPRDFRGSSGFPGPLMRDAKLDGIRSRESESVIDSRLR